MTENLPHVTQVIAQLSKPALIPWATGLGVEFMKEKTIELIGGSLTKLVYEIEGSSLIKTEAMVDKLKKVMDDLNKHFRADTSEIAKEAKSQHTKKKDEAADRGKRAHAAIESFLQANDGAQIDVDEDIAKPFKKFIDWWILNEVEVVEVECPVWSEEGGGYKGRFDLAANLKKEGKNILYLIDIKFTPRIYDDVKMQLGAYFYGWKQRTTYIPERAGVLRLDFTDQPEEFKIILESELYKHYQAFLKLVEYWHLIND
ncbi:hypothetical protein ES705_05311 [subsurface metagenome]